MGPQRLQLGHALLDPLVGVAQALFQSQHLLTDDGKPKVPRLNDAGVHRPHWNLVYAVALHPHEGVVCQGTGRRSGQIARVLQQGVVVVCPGAVVEPGALIRSTRGHHT